MPLATAVASRPEHPRQRHAAARKQRFRGRAGVSAGRSQVWVPSPARPRRRR